MIFETCMAGDCRTRIQAFDFELPNRYHLIVERHFNGLGLMDIDATDCHREFIDSHASADVLHARTADIEFSLETRDAGDVPVRNEVLGSDVGNLELELSVPSPRSVTRN